ncbi:hypothetical protein FRC08_004987 [Ceratobasidium sp. 394]|nr:hypothetical protein FRC08_004987 [Ceratobasidium sp. 394]
MSLTTTMGVKLGPIVLGTLFKHYLERHTVIRDSKARNELLFDEAFIVVKVSFIYFSRMQRTKFDVWVVVFGGEFETYWSVFVYSSIGVCRI